MSVLCEELSSFGITEPSSEALTAQPRVTQTRGHYGGIINTNIAIMSLLHPLMSPLAPNPPGRIYLVYGHLLFTRMHRTAVVIKLSSLARFKFIVMTGRAT